MEYSYFKFVLNIGPLSLFWRLHGKRDGDRALRISLSPSWKCFQKPLPQNLLRLIKPRPDYSALSSNSFKYNFRLL